ncbi:MAG: TetR/AcrR family transcriptional regulator [Tissierellia bacterium]|nr:TetR/AcrR family transcriptional regulator [Tissierellia bacterium]
MSKQKSKSQINNTKQEILDAASKLIAQKGVKDTSLADISRKIGISKGTLYYYYSTKDDIIFDIADIHLKEMTEELLLWLENIEDNANPKEILMVVFEKILSAETRGKLHLYLISDAVVGNNVLKERFIARYKEWRITLEDGARMVFKDRKVNYEVISHIILAILDGLTIQRMLGIENLPLKDFAEFLCSGE